MIVINSEELKDLVTHLVTGARKAKLDERTIYISTEDEFITFYFNGEDLSVQKKLEADITKGIETAISAKELHVKVDALPKGEKITLLMDGKLLKMKWGRSSEINVNVFPETSPLIEIPEIDQSIIWKPGTLRYLNETHPAFAAKTGSSTAKSLPITAGVHLSMDDTGDVYLRATDRVKGVRVKLSNIEWFKDIPLSIPTASLDCLNAVISDQGEIKLGINKQKTLLTFEAGHTIAVSRIIQGDMVNIDRFFSSEGEEMTKWMFDRLELVDLARRISKLDPDNPVITFTKEKKKILGTLAGIMTQQVGAVCEGEYFSFSVQAPQLEVAAALFEKDEIHLSFQNDKGPITVRCEQDKSVNVIVGQVNVN